ncbi:hypothetical protein K437DRAFT_262097 [Tilletiaria anomala UBC 951]|uniref:Protein-lysine N-methyltransferase EFM6 n=1 Tax=Tilletiaria anomala (strain ATCC 24038 / CBS 436.72 / UBC 951) TaxID=1037660 RepID=A0A066WDM5_TILAU|nr:uncharacterized protein K437DRAFT_262097 [Tilletiaria anomala UBC 951]KDN49209.1 hypothetical protein K437DRAFT_262097 [Tilletiaria anomala UBC 951]
MAVAAQTLLAAEPGAEAHGRLSLRQASVLSHPQDDDRPLLNLFSGNGSEANISDDENSDESTDAASPVAGPSSRKAVAQGAAESELVPAQRQSILNRRAVVRYFSDATKTPEVHDITPPAASSSSSPTSTLPIARTLGATDARGTQYDVLLKLDVSTGCGGRIWPAAEVLGAYLASHGPDLRERWRGRTIVELGAGTGLAGLLVARMGLGVQGVWITDQDAMMQLMRENLALNQTQAQAPLPDPCHVEELNWGEPIPDTVPSQPDVLLLADCVYLEIAFQPLVDTMAALSTPATEILFCYQKRRKADKRFFALLRKKFTFDNVDDDDPVRMERYRREGTQLLRVRRKQS